ncbi:MAG: flagellar basal body L-ring protein FlgH [Smithellaceae bacterium]
MPENPLHLLMNPKSIATVGAGNNIQKMGSIHANNLLKCGYKGKFYPVHPKDDIVLGHKAYPSVSELPEAPDLAFLVVPANQVAPLLEAFGKIGTRRAIVITAGFKETGTEGIKMEEEIVNVAGKYGIRFLGPNCIGTINTRDLVNTTVRPQSTRPGRLGLASQSGTYVSQTCVTLMDRGILYSKAISLGNEANIDIVDAMEYLGEDKDTRAIILYIEGIRDGRRFIEAAQKITPHKPVLALYIGGSEAGARAGLSHTGALAGPDYLYDGIFKQAGIIRVQTVEELYGHGWALATQPPLRGNRLGILTTSGGPGSSIAYTAELDGLNIPIFSGTLQDKIRKSIAGHASSKNPVDITFSLDKQVVTTGIPEIIMKSGEVDGLIVHGATDSRAFFTAHADTSENSPSAVIPAMEPVDLSMAVSLPGKYGQPMLMSSFYDRRDAYTAYYEDHDIPVYDFPETAAGGNKASTNTSRDTSTAASVSSLLGIENAILGSNATMGGSIGLGGTSKNALKGSGDTSRNSTLEARISASVLKVFDNGNMLIEGKRKLTVNAEDQYIIISGIVRPDDITAENTVASQYIADARIVYTGDGVVNDKMRPGWLTRVVDWVWPF